MDVVHSRPPALQVLNNDIATNIARHLLGEPNKALSTKRELRFGSKGSLSVIIGGQKVGSFYDHEHGTGGDLLTLIQHVTGTDFRGALDLARDFGGDLPSSNHPQSSKPDADEAAKRLRAARF